MTTKILDHNGNEHTLTQYADCPTLYYGSTANCHNSEATDPVSPPKHDNGVQKPRVGPNQLAYYHTVRAGKIKVCTLPGLIAPTWIHSLWKVPVRVTERNNRWYTCGQIIVTSPLNLSRRF